MSTSITIPVKNAYSSSTGPTFRVSSQGGYFESDDVPPPLATHNFNVDYTGTSPFKDTLIIKRKNGNDVDIDCYACYNKTKHYRDTLKKKIEVPITIYFGSEIELDETSKTVTVGNDQPC